MRGWFRDYWNELSFSLWRRNQLIGIGGLVVLLVVVVLMIQRGPFTVIPSSFLLAAPDEGTPGGPTIQTNESDDSAGVIVSSTEDQTLAIDLDDDNSSKVAAKNTSGSKDKLLSATSETGEVTSGGDRQLTVVTLRVPDGNDEAGADEITDDGSTSRDEDVRFENCADAVAAGATPISLGDPGYRLSLDADKDGLACEDGADPEDAGQTPPDSLLTATSSTTTASTSTTSTTRPSTTSPPTTTAATTTTSATTTSTASSTTTSSSTTTTTEATTTTTERTTTTTEATTTTTNPTTTTTEPTTTTTEPTTTTTEATTTSDPATTSTTEDDGNPGSDESTNVDGGPL